MASSAADIAAEIVPACALLFVSMPVPLCRLPDSIKNFIYIVRSPISSPVSPINHRDYHKCLYPFLFLSPDSFNSIQII